MDDYEYLRVRVDASGLAVIEYHPACEHGQPQAMSHDEDVSGWTDDEIAQLAFDLLAIPGEAEAGDEPGQVPVIWD